jgi:hypothetical protein
MARTKRRKFTTEFKNETVKLIREIDRRVADVIVPGFDWKPAGRYAKPENRDWPISFLRLRMARRRPSTHRQPLPGGFPGTTQRATGLAVASA